MSAGNPRRTDAAAQFGRCQDDCETFEDNLPETAELNLSQHQDHGLAGIYALPVDWHCRAVAIGRLAAAEGELAPMMKRSRCWAPIFRRAEQDEVARRLRPFSVPRGPDFGAWHVQLRSDGAVILQWPLVPMRHSSGSLTPQSFPPHVMGHRPPRHAH
jgi:hypothetical protein